MPAARPRRGTVLCTRCTIWCWAKAAAPPCPDAVRLTLDRAPAPAEVTDFMMRGEDDPGAWDNFYSELCTKLARGAAEVWAVRREGALVSTAGAYALSPDTAYLAAVETLEALRGQGIGGWLTGLLAADLASPGAACGTLLQKRTAEFLPPSWLCGGGYRAALCAGRAAGGKIKGLRSREEKQGGVPPTLR